MVVLESLNLELSHYLKASLVDIREGTKVDVNLDDGKLSVEGDVDNGLH